jgi:hypothetical protein
MSGDSVPSSKDLIMESFHLDNRMLQCQQSAEPVGVLRLTPLTITASPSLPHESIGVLTVVKIQ